MSERTEDLLYDWNDHLGAAPRVRRVEVDDETLRDGLQSPSVQSPSGEQKRECLRLMCALGIQRVDVGLPMSSQQGDIRAMLQTIRDESLPIKPGLAVRTVQSDFETVAAFRDEFPSLDIKANAFLGSSRLRRWVESWSWDTVLDRTAGTIEWAAGHGIPVMFVTEDTTRTHPEDVARLYQRAVQAAVDQDKEKMESHLAFYGKVMESNFNIFQKSMAQIKREADEIRRTFQQKRMGLI